MKKVALSVFTFVLTAATPANAASGGPQAPSMKPVSTRPISSARGGVPLFDEVHLEIFSDGSRHVTARRTRHVVSEDEVYFFVLDMHANTYRAVKLPSSEAALARTVVGLLAEYPEVSDRVLVAERLSKRLTTQRATAQAFLTDPQILGEFEVHPPLCDEIDECDFECSGSWSASVTTFDPIYVSLTETSSYSNWERYTLKTCKWRAFGVNGCWAANPSAAGTHWYVSSCGKSGPVTSDLAYDFTALGSYYNYDFGLDSQITQVSQSVRTQLKLGIGVVTSWSHVDGGEFSYLIFGSFSQTGTNTCF